MNSLHSLNLGVSFFSVWSLLLFLSLILSAVLSLSFLFIWLMTFWCPLSSVNWFTHCYHSPHIKGCKAGTLHHQPWQFDNNQILLLVEHHLFFLDNILSILPKSSFPVFMLFLWIMLVVLFYTFDIISHIRPSLNKRLLQNCWAKNIYLVCQRSLFCMRS